MISTFHVERVRSQLKAAELKGEGNGPCGYPRTITLPWYALLWQQGGLGWMIRDIRDQQARVVL